MSETLTGDHKVETAYELEFGTDVDFKEICTKEYGRDELSKLSTAIEEDVSKQFYYCCSFTVLALTTISYLSFLYSY